MKAVMYGAGNIGRGFIGQVFAQSGYELTFIDVAEPVVAALNRDGRYPVRLLSESGCRDVWIEGVKAVNGNNAEDAARAIAEADIMATAVGVRV
ncbi:MAG: mannitol-1-phosphate 5-dehydrogenase, partial [Treponema sp.]|nr:mannitol-1-phosphate 5-dehydrogenase [Treponema sp.]